MGLVNLKTDLKSLKYGNDRPGGGSSNQPYIVTPIPDDITTNGPDFLLRQGALQASLKDNERLTKFFTDNLSTNGVLFTTKQIALERQNPIMPGGLTRVYLPTSTLSQVLLLPEGVHLNKQGVDPFQLSYAQGGRGGYFNYTLNKDLQEDTSRLSLLYDTKIANTSNIIGRRDASLREFHISRDNEYSLSYNGGPDSIGGIGRTRIRLAGNDPYSSRDRTSTYRLDKVSFQLNQSSLIGPVSTPINSDNVYTFDNDLLSQQVSTGRTKSTSLSGITDYRKKINNSLSQPILPQTTYEGSEGFNRETTYKTSVTYYSVNPSALQNPNGSVSSDKINAYSIATEYDVATDTEANLLNSDLIKFFFEVIDPTVTETTSEYLFFRAYLTNIGDSFKSDWQPYKYVGRAENFYRYGGFSRDVSLSFTIYAHSREEMIPLYEKLNALVGTTAPRYSDKGYMLGNFIKLTVGTYFNSVPGIINSITLKPSFEAGWDINRDASGNPLTYKEGRGTYKTTGYVGQVPRMIEIDLSFTPIHSFTPQYSTNLNTSAYNFINNTPLPQPPPSPQSSVGTGETINTTPLSKPSPPQTQPVNFTNPITTNLTQLLNPGLGSGVLL